MADFVITQETSTSVVVQEVELQVVEVITAGPQGPVAADGMRISVYDLNNDGKVNAAEVADVVAWSGVTGKPDNATSTIDGFMSSTDKTKLDGIAAGAQVNTVTSVAGRIGAVTLVKGDVGLGSVDNTADNVKVVASADKLTTAKTIAGTGFDGTSNIDISYSNLINKPSLGTVAAKDVAALGNASTTQVVMGNDTRLTDARTPTAPNP